jgi:glycosyltransferase involved in cell wall biosynthesis
MSVASLNNDAPEIGDLVAPKKSPNRPTVIFLVTEDWYFWSHRVPIARAVRDAGFRVIVATRVRDYGERIKSEGFELCPLPWRRRGDGILGALKALFAITRLYISEAPVLVHHVALKPMVFGALCAFLAGVPRQINMLAGLGFVFVSPTPLAVVQRAAILLALKLLVDRDRSQVVVQNREDGEELIRRGVLDRRRCTLIAGSGVDTSHFIDKPEPPASPVVVTMVSRMLRYKGVSVLVDAARELKRRKRPITVRLVGPVDPDNPSSLTAAELMAWQDDGVVEWSGAQDDIAGIWARSHIAVFPSMYREGVPKALLEAAACGRPIVTTDIPGCKDVVDDGKTGYLVPQGDVESLVAAIETLAAAPELRRKMGLEGRRKVQLRFGEELIVTQMMAIYREALSRRRGWVTG